MSGSDVESSRSPLSPLSGLRVTATMGAPPSESIRLEAGLKGRFVASSKVQVRRTCGDRLHVVA